MTNPWPYPSLADPAWLAPPADDPYLGAARDVVRRLVRPQSTGRPATQEELLRALTTAQEVRDRLDWALLSLVGEGRASGLSWAQVAEALGVRRQAAHQRYGRWVAAALDQAGAPLGRQTPEPGTPNG